MRWLVGTLATLGVWAVWLCAALALDLQAFVIGHIGGVICAAGSTLACRGRLWASDD